MARVALILSFFGAGVSFLFPALQPYGFPDWIPYPTLLLHLPAVILGTLAWTKTPAITKSAPIVAILVLALLGILWTEPSERGRALIIFAQLAVVPPIAALIIREDLAELVEKVFVFACFAALIASLVLFRESSFQRYSERFELTNEMGTAVTHANLFGAQMGFAAVLSLFRVFRSLNRADSPASGSLERLFNIAVIPLFLAGLVLSGSRGAIVATITGLTVITLIALRRTVSKRASLLLSSLVIWIFLGGAVVSFYDSFLSEHSYLAPVESRFADTESVYSVGDRIPIWNSAYSAITCDVEHLVYGAGTGGADRWLGRFYLFAEPGLDGVIRHSTHNTFVEWVLCFGLLGLVLGFVLLALSAKIIYFAYRHNRPTFLGLGLWAFWFMHSMVLPSYRSPFWPVLGSLLLVGLHVMKRSTAEDRVEIAGRQPRQIAKVPINRGGGDL